MESVCTDIDKPYNLEDVSVLGPHATYVCMPKKKSSDVEVQCTDLNACSVLCLNVNIIL